MTDLQSLGVGRSLLFFAAVAFLFCLQIANVSPTASSAGNAMAQTAQASQGKSKDIPTSLENSNVRYFPCFCYCKRAVR